jgi:hypothetical protein
VTEAVADKPTEAPKKRVNKKYKVFCHNCGVYILDTTQAKLRKEPELDATMFTHRKDVEWDYFPPDAGLSELVCPQCGWLFHDNGHVMTKPARKGRRKKLSDTYS